MCSNCLMAFANGCIRDPALPVDAFLWDLPLFLEVFPPRFLFVEHAECQEPACGISCLVECNKHVTDF